MSEVDRLSNSDLYPTLPIAEERGRKDGSGPGGGKSADPRPPPATPSSGTREPSRTPKSLIDDYA
jgi:hypothetical protein